MRLERRAVTEFDCFLYSLDVETPTERAWTIFLAQQRRLFSARHLLDQLGPSVPVVQLRALLDEIECLVGEADCLLEEVSEATDR